jgi:hypothetical protein
MPLKRSGCVRNIIRCLVISSMLGLIGHCSNSAPHEMAGGGVENGNGFICGYLYTPDGLPAQDAVVRLIPFKSDPLKNDTGSAIAMTDENGHYNFNITPAGAYNLLGEAPDGRLLSYADSLVVGRDSLVFPADTLRLPGQFRGVIGLQPYRNCMIFILILGTDQYALTIDTVGNFISPKLAEGRYTVLIISTAPGFNHKELTVTVNAGSTTTIDTVYVSNSFIPTNTYLDTTLSKTFHAAKAHLPGYYGGTQRTSQSLLIYLTAIIDSDFHFSAYNNKALAYAALFCHESQAMGGYPGR